MSRIAFNKPFLTGQELNYIKEAVLSAKISGDGAFTKRCHNFFQTRYGFKKVLLTTSCTDALEMSALLSGIQPGDEVIAPSYAFVSTANPFILRGGKVVFADSEANTPNIDVSKIETLITSKTRAIVVLHYAGFACNMDEVLAIAEKHRLIVIEDAAQAIDSYYKGKPLGSLGHLAAFSFHETKNVISGEGGMFVINDDQFIERGEIIWEKGTNRSAFFRGEIDKYGWVDIGSSFLPSEIIAAFLFAQLENIDSIQAKRKKIWNQYFQHLHLLAQRGYFQLPVIPDYATNNAHMFYLICNNLDQRTRLISFLKERDINAVFHYISLHSSPYFKNKHDGRALPNADRYSECLVRLPLYFDLSENETMRVIQGISDFYNSSVK